MENLDRRKHWENIYKTKQSGQASWYESVPATSLHFLKLAGLPKTAKIIDMGGGDSFFVDHLLDLGYRDITIVDISETAINRAKERLGEKAANVKWIVADAAAFRAPEQYDFWHDRAAFHFLTDVKDMERYIDTVQQSLRPAGILVIGTFSGQGPQKCSGLSIRQYSERTMEQSWKTFFRKLNCVSVDHRTPAGAVQNFIFCSFQKLQAT